MIKNKDAAKPIVVRPPSQILKMLRDLRKASEGKEEIDIRGGNQPCLL